MDRIGFFLLSTLAPLGASGDDESAGSCRRGRMVAGAEPRSPPER
jgi:hypothetical protein